MYGVLYKIMVSNFLLPSYIWSICSIASFKGPTFLILLASHSLICSFIKGQLLVSFFRNLCLNQGCISPSFLLDIICLFLKFSSSTHFKLILVTDVKYRLKFSLFLSLSISIFLSLFVSVWQLFQHH